MELTIRKTTARFKMWNPDGGFYNHQDDNIVDDENAAVEAIIITLGKSTVYW